jgi:ubiquinone biosynthesis protein COQ9
MSEIAPSDMTLDELRLAPFPADPGHAVFDGWSDEALAMAARRSASQRPARSSRFPGARGT